MAASCVFCERLRKDVEDTLYYQEQARKNGRRNADRVSTKYVGAYISKSYIDNDVTGRFTMHFDEEIRFCPYCAADLHPILHPTQSTE